MKARRYPEDHRHQHDRRRRPARRLAMPLPKPLDQGAEPLRVHPEGDRPAPAQAVDPVAAFQKELTQGDVLQDLALHRLVPAELQVVPPRADDAGAKGAEGRKTRSQGRKGPHAGHDDDVEVRRSAARRRAACGGTARPKPGRAAGPRSTAIRRRPSASRTVSASRNTRSCPEACRAPCQQAQGLPSHPGGRPRERRTRAPPAAATAAVSSSDWSSTTRTSTGTRLCRRSDSSSRGRLWASLRAGITTDTGGAGTVVRRQVGILQSEKNPRSQIPRSSAIQTVSIG